MRLIEPAGLGAVPNPDLEFEQTLGWWTPHRRSKSARYFRVENSRCLELPGAGEVEVMKDGVFFLESCYIPKRA